MNPLRDLGGLLAKQSTPLPYRWDRDLIEELIAENHAQGFQPTCLVLGRREVAMLKRHLGNNFGPPAAQSLKNTYYLGLKIVEDSATSLLCVAGRLSDLPPTLGQPPSSARSGFPPPFTSHHWRFSS